MQIVQRGVTLCLSVVVGFGAGIFSLPVGVEAQSHSNLKNTIQNQGQRTRGVVRSKNTENISEYTQQHDMIKQDLSDAQTAIQTDIAEVKALVEALEPGAAAPPCGAGTEGSGLSRTRLKCVTTPQVSTGSKLWIQLHGPTRMR